MADVRIILSGLWVAVMLTYLLGDVLRLFAGDITPGEIEGRKASQGMWLGIAVIMLIPIIMVVLSLTLPYPAIGWVNIVVAVLVVVFNLVRLALQRPLRQLPDHRELRLQRIDRLVRMDVGLYGCLASLLGASPRRCGSSVTPATQTELTFNPGVIHPGSAT